MLARRKRRNKFFVLLLMPDIFPAFFVFCDFVVYLSFLCLSLCGLLSSIELLEFHEVRAEGSDLGEPQRTVKLLVK